MPQAKRRKINDSVSQLLCYMFNYMRVCQKIFRELESDSINNIRIKSVDERRLRFASKCNNYLKIDRIFTYNHEDLGLISKSKIAVGMERVQQALGTSTMEAILPYTGAHPSRRYACSPVYPRVLR
jgi:hypothetical protein